MAREFSIMCQMMRERRLPANSKHGLVLISISHTLPLESIKKSYPNTSNEKIFFSPLSLSSAALMLVFPNSFILLIVASKLMSFDFSSISRSL